MRISGMNTRHALPLAALGFAALMPLAPAFADGCPPSQCGLFSAATPGSRYLKVHTNGEHGPLRVFDVVARRQVASLPPGLTSADGRRFVTVRTIRKTQTFVTTYALPRGNRLSERQLAGRHGLTAVSRDGRRVVLVLIGGPSRTTTFEVLDRGRLTRVVRLRGAYEVETLSPDGRRMFLVHWRDNSYSLELYDFGTGRLRPTPTFEEGAAEKMVGQAWRAIASRNGAWLLTLYLKGNGGFVHALDLRRGIGHCIDLPVHTQNLSLGASGLALSPDERLLYVVTPVLGRVFTIDLRGPRLARTARFESWLGPDEVGFGMSPNAAVSPNGRTVYFNGNGLVWAYDAAYGRVRGPYPAGRIVMALAFTPDGRRVVAFGGDGKSRALNAATGRRLG
jgi:hypothetical protein